MHRATVRRCDDANGGRFHRAFASAPSLFLAGVEVTGHKERPEIDVLRGIAALFMVIHHAWARSPVELSPLAAQVVFLGSCAPVLFFFVTGLGYGLSRGRPRAPSGAPSGAPSDALSGGRSGSIATKLAVLFVADQLMAWSHGARLGLDFLGFIALASLLLEGVARSRRALALALGLAAVVVAARFGLGSAAVLTRAGDARHLLGLLVGAEAIAGVSYPPAPWLAYPLLGFCAGRLLGAGRTRELALAVIVVVLGAAGLGIALAARDAVIFRWGTVSLAFFARSFVVLGGCVVVAAVIARAAPATLTRALGLRGVSSLALVPIHYVVIEIGTAAVAPARQVPLLLLTGAAVVASFLMSRRFGALVERAPAGAAAATIGAAIAAACGAALIVLSPEGLVAVLLMAGGQLSLCALLPRRPA